MNGSVKFVLERNLTSQLDILSTNFQFAASVRLHGNEVLNENCYKDGESTPVSFEELKKLAGVTSKGNDVVGLTNKVTQKMWHSVDQKALEESKISAQVGNYSETLPKLTNRMLQLMGIDSSAIEVKLTLQHTVICGTGSTVKFPFDKHNGGFDKIILQIPVEGGHEGGRIKVEFNDQIRLFNLCDGSDSYYHLTSFYSDCDYTFEEVTFGWRLAMVFNLELKSSLFPHSLSPSADLHTFLTVKDVQSIISQWYTEDNPDKLVLLLEHRYTPSELSFCRLKSRDRLLVRLLLAVDTVDMYLTHLQNSECELPPLETEDTADDNSETDCSACVCCVDRDCRCLAKEETFDQTFQLNTQIDVEFSSLTCIDDRIIEIFNINVDINKEMIRFNHNLFKLDPDDFLEDYDLPQTEDVFDIDALRYVFNSRAVLVISPKHSLSFELICNFSFALEKLEANPDVSVLNKVITYCQLNPTKVWLGVKDREERTRRLVSICLQLKAKSEGLKLLKLLSSNFPGHPIFYEGLRNKVIAIEVANLIKMVGLNLTSSDCINDFFSECRAIEQIENYAHLVVRLFDLGLTEMAVYYGKICMQFFCNNNLFFHFSASTIVSCLALFFLMNEKNRTNGPFLVPSLFFGVKFLNPHKLIFVIQGIQTTCRSYLVNNRECHKLQQCLHMELFSKLIPHDVAVEVMSFYLKLNDSTLLKKLIEELVNNENVEAIEMIVASPEIWNLAETTQNGKCALDSLVSTRIHHLENMRMPIFSWIQGNAVFDGEEMLKTFFHSSTVRESFHGFTNRQHAENWIKDLFGPNQLKCGYSAKAEIRYEGSKIECVVTKTRGLHLYNLKLFHQSRSELLALRERRLRRLPTNNSSNGKVSLNRSYAYSSLISSPASKRRHSSDIERN